MVDYEKGSPAWDIGIILTRHESGTFGAFACAKVVEIRGGGARDERLKRAWATECTCGMGDSPAEHTSERP